VVTHGVIAQLLISWWLTGALDRANRFSVSNGSLCILDFPANSHVRLLAANVVASEGFKDATQFLTKFCFNQIGEFL